MPENTMTFRGVLRSVSLTLHTFYVLVGIFNGTKTSPSQAGPRTFVSGEAILPCPLGVAHWSTMTLVSRMYFHELSVRQGGGGGGSLVRRGRDVRRWVGGP